MRAIWHGIESWEFDIAVMRWLLPVLLIAAAVAGCSRTTDEQRIRMTISAMQQAMESHNPRAFMTHVSDDFIGNEAGFDREALANLLRAEVFRNDDVGVTLGPIEIEMQGDRATARLIATFTGGNGGGLLPERGSIYTITSGWKRRGSDWICFSGRWEQKL